MLLRGALILFGVWSISPPLPAKTLLNGTAQLCPEEDAKDDTAGVRGVRVYAFDAAKVANVRASLAALDAISWSGEDVEAMRSFSAEYRKLNEALKHTPQLGAAVTDEHGDFRLKVPQADSVLLFAAEELEDQPFFFASKVLAIKGRAEVRVVLPMCNKRV